MAEGIIHASNHNIVIKIQNSFIFGGTVKVVGELPKIVFWLSRIGREGKTLSQISPNSRKAHEALSLLARHGLVRTRRLGRATYVVPTEKGLRAIAIIEQLREEVYGNPWLHVIAEKARRRIGVEG